MNLFISRKFLNVLLACEFPQGSDIHVDLRDGLKS